MLKQRLLTALILVPLVILAIWYMPTAWVAALVGLLMLGCAWEWALFVPLEGGMRLGFVALCAALMVALHPALALVPSEVVLLPALIWWVLASAWLAVYPRGFGPGRPAPALRALLGVLSVLGCYVAIWQLHAEEQGRLWLYLLLVIVWATDTGGYFAGKQFGKHKLAAQISPKKTWEGLWGGVLLAVALAVSAHWLMPQSPAVWHLVLLGLGVALISVVGDLTVSMFKRQSGVKDTGNLFPGHGGALDRLDSLLAGAPVLYLVQQALGAQA